MKSATVSDIGYPPMQLPIRHGKVRANQSGGDPVRTGRQRQIAVEDLSGNEVRRPGVQ